MLNLLKLGWDQLLTYFIAAIVAVFLVVYLVTGRIF